MGCGYRNYQNTIEKIIVSEGIEIIGRSTFRGTKNLKEIVWPTTLKEIRAYAIDDCPNLVKNDIPEGVEIGSYSVE